MDVAAVVADETLEDGAMLGVDRQELDATPSGGRRHQVPGHHQRLLVGERHGAPGQDPRHRRQEPGGTHERRHDDVGLDVPGERDEPLWSGEQLGPRWREEAAQAVHRAAVEQRDRGRRELAAEIRDQLDVRPARREPRHLELFREARDDLESAEPDRSRRTEEREPLHTPPKRRVRRWNSATAR